MPSVLRKMLTGGLAQVVSEGSSISSWARDHSCDTLVKSTTFYPCPKNLPETELKNNRLSFLEISRQSNIDSVV